MTIGVLAIQGDFDAHRIRLEELGATVVLVRTPEQLEALDGIIIPGGESSTILKFLERGTFFEQLRAFVSAKPAFGTCAGAILLAKEVSNPPQTSLGTLDICVQRNAYGRQLESEIRTEPTELDGGDLEMVFIRAPRIESSGPNVKVLARLDKDPVLVREGSTMAATFHPELSRDTRVHAEFLRIVAQCKT